MLPDAEPVETVTRFGEDVVKPIEIVRRIVSEFVMSALALYGLYSLLSESPLVKISIL